MIRQTAIGGSLARCLLGILMCVFLSASVHADAVIEVTPDQSIIDLAKVGTRVAAQRRNLALEVPGDAEGQIRVLELRGQGAAN